MQEVLTEKLGGVKYNVDDANKRAKEITDQIKNKLKGPASLCATERSYHSIFGTRAWKRRGCHSTTLRAASPRRAELSEGDTDEWCVQSFSGSGTSMWFRW
jgi:hypothetical protein